MAARRLNIPADVIIPVSELRPEASADASMAGCVLSQSAPVCAGSVGHITQGRRRRAVRDTRGRPGRGRISQSETASPKFPCRLCPRSKNTIPFAISRLPAAAGTRYMTMSPWDGLDAGMRITSIGWARIDAANIARPSQNALVTADPKA
jgi:hypothetical protein